MSTFAIIQRLQAEGFVRLGSVTLCDLDHTYYAHPQLLLLADVCEWRGVAQEWLERTTIPHLAALLVRIWREREPQRRRQVGALITRALRELHRLGFAEAAEWEVAD